VNTAARDEGSICLGIAFPSQLVQPPWELSATCSDNYCSAD